MKGAFGQELVGNLLACLGVRKVVEADDDIACALLELGAHESYASIDLG